MNSTLSNLPSSMREVLLSLSTGTLVGVIFSLVKLPIPAPQALAGIAGIVGIYVGYVGVAHLIRIFG